MLAPTVHTVPLQLLDLTALNLQDMELMPVLEVLVVVLLLLNLSVAMLAVLVVLEVVMMLPQHLLLALLVILKVLETLLWTLLVCSCSIEQDLLGMLDHVVLMYHVLSGGCRIAWMKVCGGGRITKEGGTAGETCRLLVLVVFQLVLYNLAG